MRPRPKPRLQERQRARPEVPIVNSNQRVTANPDFEQPDQVQHKDPEQELLEEQQREQAEQKRLDNERLLQMAKERERPKKKRDFSKRKPRAEIVAISKSLLKDGFTREFAEQFRDWKASLPQEQRGKKNTLLLKRARTYAKKVGGAANVTWDMMKDQAESYKAQATAPAPRGEERRARKHKELWNNFATEILHYGFNRQAVIQASLYLKNRFGVGNTKEDRKSQRTLMRTWKKKLKVIRDKNKNTKDILQLLNNTDLLKEVGVSLEEKPKEKPAESIAAEQPKEKPKGPLWPPPASKEAFLTIQGRQYVYYSIGRGRGTRVFYRDVHNTIHQFSSKAKLTIHIANAYRVKSEPEPLKAPVIPHGQAGSKQLPLVADVEDIMPEPMGTPQYEQELPPPLDEGEPLEAIEFHAAHNRGESVGTVGTDEPSKDGAATRLRKEAEELGMLPNRPKRARPAPGIYKDYSTDGSNASTPSAYGSSPEFDNDSVASDNNPVSSGSLALFGQSNESTESIPDEKLDEAPPTQEKPEVIDADLQREIDADDASVDSLAGLSVFSQEPPQRQLSFGGRTDINVDNPQPNRDAVDNPFGYSMDPIPGLNQYGQYEMPPLEREEKVDEMEVDLGLDDDESEFVPDFNEPVNDEEYEEAPIRQPPRRQSGGNYRTMGTRWTDTSIRPEIAQEAVVNPRPGIAVGIRNVRQRPERFRNVPVRVADRPLVRREPLEVTRVPGGYVNPHVQNWYYQNAFESKPKRSWASQEMPWLFGEHGLYPQIYEECEDECMVDGVCIC